MDNHVFTEFEASLALGKHNESVIAHEFGYQGVPLLQTIGKNAVDFYLPSGKSVEVKIDLRSQATGSGCIERPTLDRNADFYIYTFTYAKVYTHALLEVLYNRGKIPGDGVGQQKYDARYVWHMGSEGIPLHEFIKIQKSINNN